MADFFQEYEIEMWEAILKHDKEVFQKLVNPNAVMVCGGYRCLGDEYAGYIADTNYDIETYQILANEIIYSSECLVQVHYVVKTEVRDPDNSDLGGTFHVTSTWEKENDEWKLIFNMDSKILE